MSGLRIDLCLRLSPFRFRIRASRQAGLLSSTDCRLSGGRLWLMCLPTRERSGFGWRRSGLIRSQLCTRIVRSRRRRGRHAGASHGRSRRCVARGSSGMDGHLGPTTASELGELLGLPASEIDKALLRIEATGAILRGSSEQTPSAGRTAELRSTWTDQRPVPHGNGVVRTAAVGANSSADGCYFAEAD